VISLSLGQKHSMNTVTVKDIVMADIIEKIQQYEYKYGEKAAALAMVIYLVIAQ
jgi:hypothetical protein